MIQFFRAHSAQKKNHIFEYLETYWKILIFLQLFLVVSLKIQRNTPKNWWFEWTQQKQQICDLKPQHLTFLGEANMGRPGPPEGGGCWLGWWLVFFFCFRLAVWRVKIKKLKQDHFIAKGKGLFSRWLVQDRRSSISSFFLVRYVISHNQGLQCFFQNSMALVSEGQKFKMPSQFQKSLSTPADGWIWG